MVKLATSMAHSATTQLRKALPGQVLESQADNRLMQPARPWRPAPRPVARRDDRTNTAALVTMVKMPVRIRVGFMAMLHSISSLMHTPIRAVGSRMANRPSTMPRIRQAAQVLLALAE